MSGEIEIFPIDLLVKEKQKEVEDYLNKLLRAKVPPRRIKQALNAWCIYVGVRMTREKVERVFAGFEVPR